MMKLAVVLLLVLNVACGFVLTSYRPGQEVLDENTSWDDTLYRMTKLPREVPDTTVLDPLVKGELLAPEGEKREASAFELHDAEKGVATGKININTATAKELMTLPRIGKGSAEKIIKFREEHDGFKTIVEITQVPRIGKSAFEGFRDMITVSGTSTAAATAAAPDPADGTSSASPPDATAVVAAAPAAGEESSSGKINLNTASVKQLMTLPRIGKGTAEKIIRYRDEHGGFKTVDELSNVSRIGTKMVDKLRPLVTVGASTVTVGASTVIVGASTVTVGGASAVPTADTPAVDAPATDQPVSAEPVKPPPDAAVPAAGKLDLNTATVEQLMTLPRVGKGTAEKIIKYRDEQGGFKTVDDLANVPRMGPKTVDNLREFITVSGGASSTTVVKQPQAPAAPAPATPATGKINLNTATVEQLMTLPRVGQGTAEKIVKYRQEHGGFKTVDDLVNVPRMGKKTVDNLRAFITVGGASAAPSTPAVKKAPAGGTSGKINLNTATTEELQQLPWVGPGAAAKIIEYRTLHGKYTSVQDLLKIKGFSQTALDAIKNLVVTE